MAGLSYGFIPTKEIAFHEAGKYPMGSCGLLDLHSIGSRTMQSAVKHAGGFSSKDAAI
jgi:hypothetical protein